jgi:hypothetical protein
MSPLHWLLLALALPPLAFLAFLTLCALAYFAVVPLFAALEALLSPLAHEEN